MSEITPTTSDEELMNLYLQANFSAFDELYRRHAGRLFGYLQKSVGPAVAEELLQDTFARVHASKHTFQKDYPFLPWIFTIARHILLDHLKKAETRLQSATTERDTEALAATGEPPAIDVEALLATLPPQQKHIFELRYLKDWSFEQISRDTGLNAANVRKIISRGIKNLQSTGQKS